MKRSQKQAQMRSQVRGQGRPGVESAAAGNLAALRQLDPEAQLKQLRGQKVERTFQVDRENGIDEKARTCWLSIASEEPYERWWGIEVLDMGKQSIRDARLKLGAPLLVGHDTSDQVGVVESFEITTGRKLRVLARFGRSARAEEIWQDVLDGIRRNTSVGYIIHDLVLEKSEDGVNTYRVTDWEPLEGSLVPVPADPTVGVGRAADPNAAPPISQSRSSSMNEQEEAALRAKIEAETRARIEAEMKAKAEAAAKATAESAAREKRVTDLLAVGDEFKDDGGPELARELINDQNATVETFKARMFEKQRGKQKPLATAEPGNEREAHYGAAARQQFRYGRLKAFTKDLPLGNGKVMPAQEAAHRAGMWLAATVYGKDWAQRWCRDQGMDLFQRVGNEVRVMSGTTLTGGGALVPIEMEQAVIDLRDMYGVIRKLVRVRPMSSDQKVIPRRTGGLTAYFFLDDDGTGITASDKGWDQVTLSAKKLGVLARVSKDLVEDAVIDVVDDLAQEMAYAFAVKEDNCGINGDGTSTYGGITGFRPKFVNTAYASRITLATNHDTFAEVDTTDLANVMSGVAAYGKPGAKWVMSEAGKAVMIDRLKAAAGGNDTVSLGGVLVPAYLGYEIVTSEAMPSDTATDYTNLVMAMFGRFDLAASMGNRRGIEVQVLNERYAELGQLGIVATERFDLVVHDLGTTSAKGPVAAAYGA